MKHLTVDEIKLLLSCVPNERNRLMLLVAFCHGLRVSELVELRKGTNVYPGHIKVNRLKGSEKTVQPWKKSADPILDEAAGLLKLIETLKNGERLFPMTTSGVAKLVKRAGVLAGLPPHKLHPHVLKHSCAMVMLTVAPINEVQKYLGHSSMASTGRYLRVSDEVASEAFAKAF